MGSQCVKKLSQDLICQLERLFPTQFPCQLPIILIKVLWLRFQALLKSPSQHLDQIHWLLPNQLSWENSLLLTCTTLGLLVNTLPADEKYSVLNRDNLTIPVPMQLSQEKKHFFQFFAAFLKSRLNFKYFVKIDDPHRFCILEITNSENVTW